MIHTTKFLRIYRHCITAILFILTALQVGCGGGTTGTDGGSQSNRRLRIEGEIHYKNGSSFSGVQIFILESGDSVTSDSQGAFIIQGTLREKITLLISVQGRETSVELPNIPFKVERVQLSLEVDPDTYLASLTSFVLIPSDDENAT